MITKYPKNIFKQVGNVVRYNYPAIFFFIALGSLAYVLIEILGVKEVELPVVPVTILGGGLAIFLGFRNNAAYDRWWEARKIWGAMVNSSRTFGTKVLTLMTLKHSASGTDEELKKIQKRMVYRHLAYINALRFQLRNKTKWEELKVYLSEEEYEDVVKAPNKATYLTHLQGKELEDAYENGYVDDFRHMSLVNELRDFYIHQGKSERIKKTVFPFYYTYFTEVFLWLFIILLPFSLVPNMHMSYPISVSISVAISFVFFILDKSGNITEDPFENRASDTPLTAICNTIEIDLRHMLHEEDIPTSISPRYTRYKVEYLN